MTVPRFVDTNVLLYAITRDPGDRAKATRATEILEARDLCLSAQVLQEFYVQATRPTRVDAITHERAQDLVEAFMRFPVLGVTGPLVLAAITACRRWQVSYWDAAILEAARVMGAGTVLSEDLSDGQDYDGVRVVNPFADC